VIDEWYDVINTNLVGVFLCVNFCIPHLFERGGGVIINAASPAGVAGILRADD
jgi:NAD(P)-dependent dehydrogenase (short-subunit alcohol dehydrogenase family)